MYVKAVDERKRPIRGLWVRNGNYYARLVIEDDSSGKKSVRRVRLEKAEPVAQAQAELRRLLTKREDGNPPAVKLTPKFSEFAGIIEFNQTPRPPVWMTPVVRKLFLR